MNRRSFIGMVTGGLAAIAAGIGLKSEAKTYTTFLVGEEQVETAHQQLDYVTYDDLVEPDYLEVKTWRIIVADRMKQAKDGSYIEHTKFQGIYAYHNHKPGDIVPLHSNLDPTTGNRSFAIQRDKTGKAIATWRMIMKPRSEGFTTTRSYTGSGVMGSAQFKEAIDMGHSFETIIMFDNFDNFDNSVKFGHIWSEEVTA